MKLATMMVAIAVLAGTSAKAKTSGGRTVTVYRTAHSTVPYQTEAAAMDQASKMFADIGISLLWRFGNPSRPEAGSIAIDIVTGTPATFMSGALACAFPYEGIHIRVFWDRIREYTAPREVLAHVIVHEITHILQGEARHSEEGIMKAHWGPDDLAAMAKKPLIFTALDLSLISQGIKNREAGAVANSTEAGTRPTAVAAVGIAPR